MRMHDLRTLVVLAAAVGVAACGGGDGGGVSSTPYLPAAPPDSRVKLVGKPVVGELATIGLRGTHPAGEEELPHFRYTAGGYYEVKLPGGDWEKLVVAKGYSPNSPDEAAMLQPASSPQNSDAIVVNLARLYGYDFSERGTWSSDAGGGYFAVGVPTPAGSVPASGSATYAGVVMGEADVLQDWGEWGIVNTSVDGSVSLSFDFGAGSLDGSMTLYLPDGMQPLEVSTFAFKDAVFSVGNTSYSGSFDTAATGENFFHGLFTGPNAEETIGAWAIPFLFTTSGETIAADNKVHQAWGVWIAKR